MSTSKWRKAAKTLRDELFVALYYGHKVRKLSYHEIARAFAVSDSTVLQIVRKDKLKNKYEQPIHANRATRDSVLLDKLGNGPSDAASLVWEPDDSARSLDVTFIPNGE